MPEEHSIRMSVSGWQVCLYRPDAMYYRTTLMGEDGVMDVTPNCRNHSR
jgi:hypothetical protein